LVGLNIFGLFVAFQQNGLVSVGWHQSFFIATEVFFLVLFVTKFILLVFYL